MNRQFQDIIKSYRIKSNSNNSHVYRNVFIKLNDLKEEIRGDLIQFYNEVNYIFFYSLEQFKNRKFQFRFTLIQLKFMRLS